MTEQEKALRALRASTGLSQTDFGKMLGGIPLRTIQHWESGTRPIAPYILELIRFRVEHGKKKEGSR